MAAAIAASAAISSAASSAVVRRNTKSPQFTSRPKRVKIFERGRISGEIS